MTPLGEIAATLAFRHEWGNFCNQIGSRHHPAHVVEEFPSTLTLSIQSCSVLWAQCFKAITLTPSTWLGDLCSPPLIETCLKRISDIA